MIRFECGHCHKKLGIADTEAGKMIKCPGCGEKVRIPSAAGGIAPAKKPPPPAAKPPPKPAPAKKPAAEDLVEVEPVNEDKPPARAAKARRPARHDEDEEEEEAPRRRAGRAPRHDEDEEEDEEPRRRAGRGRARDEDEEDEDAEAEEDEEKGIFSPNRIRGMVSIAMGGLVLVLALFFKSIKPDVDPDTADIVKYVGCGLAALM